MLSPNRDPTGTVNLRAEYTGHGPRAARLHSARRQRVGCFGWAKEASPHVFEGLPYFGCRSAFRLSYPSWQKVYNVGLRVVMEAGGDFELAAREK